MAGDDVVIVDRPKIDAVASEIRRIGNGLVQLIAGEHDESPRRGLCGVLNIASEVNAYAMPDDRKCDGEAERILGTSKYRRWGSILCSRMICGIRRLHSGWWMNPDLSPLSLPLPPAIPAPGLSWDHWAKTRPP